jgi:hypothetical protein
VPLDDQTVATDLAELQGADSPIINESSVRGRCFSRVETSKLFGFKMKFGWSLLLLCTEKNLQKNS